MNERECRFVKGDKRRKLERKQNQRREKEHISRRDEVRKFSSLALSFLSLALYFTLLYLPFPLASVLSPFYICFCSFNLFYLLSPLFFSIILQIVDFFCLLGSINICRYWTDKNTSGRTYSKKEISQTC